MGIQERKEREKERRKQEILVSAKRLFRERGFETTTIEEISEDAELSAGTIYLYFKNKQDLYAAVLNNVLEYLHMRLLHVVNQNIPRRVDRIAAMTDVMLEVYSNEPEFTMSLFHQLTQGRSYDDPVINMEELIRCFQEIKELTADLFKVDDGQDINKYTDAKVVTDIFWSTFIGVAVSETGKMNLFNHQRNLKKKLKIIFEIFTRGVKQLS